MYHSLMIPNALKPHRYSHFASVLEREVLFDVGKYDIEHALCCEFFVEVVVVVDLLHVGHGICGILYPRRKQRYIFHGTG